MEKIKILDVLAWIWRGKSITRAMMNVLIAENKLLKGTIIDLGGGGHPSYLDIIDIDGNFFNMDMLVEAKPSFVGNLEDPLPITSNIADTVLLFNTLEHVFNYQLVIDEMHRILKPNGKAIVFVPFLMSYHTYQGQSFLIDDFFRYTKSALIRILTNAGFIKVNITPVGGFFWVIADLLQIGLKYRFLATVSTLICGFLEVILALIRDYNSSERFPLGYFIEAEK
ncbi:MAG: methyltransferase domain-containing protein [Thermodesulfobacteriota bacterium]